MPEADGARGPRRAVPLLGCDGFLLALDAMMRRWGQGPHLSQSVVELAELPDPDALGRAWQRFTTEHRIVQAKLGRSWRGLPVWRLPKKPGNPKPAGGASGPDQVPLGRWREPAAPGRLPDARQVESLQALCLQRRDQRRGNKPTPFRVRLDLLERGQGAAVVVTWSHLLVDGKGVELLLAEVARLARADAEGDRGAGDAGAPGDGQASGEAQALEGGAACGGGEAAAARGLAPPRAEPSVRRMIGPSRAFVQHFYQLAATRFSSLSGPRPAPGRAMCRVVTLDRAVTGRVNARAQGMTNQLIQTPFFLAAAACAHARVFERRGRAPGPQVITLPVQTRPKGGRGPIFQNYVTILFFKLTDEQLTDTETATAAIQAQFARMMRQRLDRSFSVMLDLMRWMPPRLYALFLRKQMHGEITSFFHSCTGAFALGAPTLAGAGIDNAWHIPVISAPPGTGLFVGEHGGRLSLSLSWREGVIDDAERDALMDHFIEALTGEPRAATPADALSLRLCH